MQVSSPRQIASKELSELENLIKHSTGHLWEIITHRGRNHTQITLKIYPFYWRGKNVNFENFWILKLTLAFWKTLELIGCLFFFFFIGFYIYINCEKKDYSFGSRICLKQCSWVEVVFVVLVAQLCWDLCDPKDCSLPGSSVHGFLQAKLLSGLPFPSLGDLPNPAIKLRSLALQTGFLLSEPPGRP